MTLPSGNHTFIGYAKTPQAAMLADGRSATVRAQVWVGFYDEIGVKEVQLGGRDGDSDTARVTFDAQTVGLENDFSAYLDPDDDVIPALQRAAESGEPIRVAIEKTRKRKHRATKDPISPLTPINQLRGAKVDGTGADMNASRDTVRNIVALVNDTTTRSITSDHTEWAHLAENREGHVAPIGWDPVDGGEWGAPVAIATSAASTEPGIDQGILVGLVSRAVNDVMNRVLGQEMERLRSDLLDALPSGQAASNATPGRRVSPDVFVEGKPWDIRTSTNQLNLGGYLPVRYRRAFTDARDVLVTAGQPFSDDDVWTFAEQLLNMIDAVQSRSYGVNTPPDRTAASYAEAASWTRTTIDDLARDGHPIPPEDRAEWADIVTAVAVERMTQVRDRATKHLDQRGTAKQRQAAQRSAQQPKTNQPAALALPVIKGAADLAQRMQNNAAAIAKAAEDATERGQDAVLFASREVEGAIEVVPATILGDETAGWAIQPFKELLRALYKRAAAAHPETVPQAANPATPPSPAAAPQSAPQRSTQGASPYSPEVSRVLGALVNASSTSDIGTAFRIARDANILDAAIAVRPIKETETQIGAPGQEGFVRKPLSQVIDRFGRHFSSIEAAAPVPTAPAQQSDGMAGVQVEADRVADASTVPSFPVADASEGAPSDSVSAPEAQEEDEDDDAAELEAAIGEWLGRVNAARDSGNIPEVEAVIHEVEGAGASGLEIAIGDSKGKLGGWLAHVIGGMREATLAPTA